MKQLISLAALAFLVGCASVQTNAGKLLATTAVVTDGCMQGWSQWVAAKQATPEQEAKVRTAYSQYQASMSLALGAYNAMVASGDKSPWLAASDALVANQSALLALVQSFTKGGAK